MRLIYTPRSHFSRKVRLLLDAWGESVELVDVGNIADQDSEGFGGNPLSTVPTLVDGEVMVFDSDAIARYLVDRRSAADEFQVLTTDVGLLNARAVMNGVMSAEVQLILAQRTGIDTNRYDRFSKMKRVIDQGLRWLEDNATLFADAPTYAGFHLVAMWDHLALYDLVALDQPSLRRIVQRLSSVPYIANSRPQ